MSPSPQEEVQQPGAGVEDGRRPNRAWLLLRNGTLAGLRFGRALVRGARPRLAALWNHSRSSSLRDRLRQITKLVWKRALEAKPRIRKTARQAVLLGGVCALVVLSVLALGRFTLRAVPAGQIGVRYSKWSGDGVSMRDFGPGLHLSVPGVHKWYELPSGTETLSWRSGKEEENRLNVRTSDGTSVQLSMSIPYSIADGEAHLLMAKGLRTTFREQARALAEQILGNDLGSLGSADYSKTEVRTALLARSLSTLNQALARIHLKAEAILVESVTFSPAFEKKLAETQRERQRSRVLIARQLEDQEQQIILRRRSAIDRELLERRIALDVEIEDVRSAGQAQAAERVREVNKAENKLRADADREYELLIAEGEAAVARTRQAESRLRGEILAGPGGSEYLALDAARSTRFKEVTMDANDPRMPNPLNIGEMLGLFGLQRPGEGP